LACLYVKDGLDDAGEPGQDQIIDVAETLTDPCSIEPGEVSDVGPAVARHRDGEDVARTALLKFHAQHPRSW
jgi:hypothetical protein